MPELPSRPNLDQLRRQARELLRSAQSGDIVALQRIHGVSKRVNLSAAQLVVAREHGFSSWEALRGEVGQRRSTHVPAASPIEPTSPQATRSNVPSGVWRGAGSVTLAQGVLSPGTLLGWHDHAMFDATFASFQRLRLRRVRRLSLFGRPFALPAPGHPVLTMKDLDDMAITDDVGTSYGVWHMSSVSFVRRLGAEPDGPVDLAVRLEPAPPVEARWVELRGRDGTACRLIRGSLAPSETRASTLVDTDAAERELEALARSLLAHVLFFGGTMGRTREKADYVTDRQCADTLARVKELRASGALPGGPLLDDLRRLCAAVGTAGGTTAAVPERWASLLERAVLADGRPLHLNVGASLPASDGVELAVGALVSEPSAWLITVTASPGWWRYSEDRHRKWARFDAFAEDDLGGSYVSKFGGSHGAEGHEDVNLQFRPRLDPTARTVRLVFQGNREALTVDIELPETT